jgi:hypothetical protein
MNNSLQKSNKLLLDLYEAASNLNCGQGEPADIEALTKALIAFEDYFSVDGEFQFNIVKDGDVEAIIELMRQSLKGGI